MKRFGILLMLIVISSLFVIAQEKEQVDVVEKKLHKNLQRLSDSDEKISVIVQFDDKPSKAQRKWLKDNGCEEVYVAKRMNLVSVTCSGKKLGSLASDDAVDFIWEDEILTPALDFSAGQIGATAAWASGYNGTGVNVSIIDTGINTSHPALAGKVILEHDFSPEGTTDDVCDHGTRVASVVASIDETYKGVAHGASLFNAKAGRILSTGQCGLSFTDIMEAMDWSVDNGAQVISLSAGGVVSNCSTSVTANYVDTLVEEKNIPFVIIAGNSGPGSQSIWTPGCARKAITIGAVGDINDLAEFSSRGPVVGNESWSKPDLVAPGVDIFAASGGGSGFSEVDGTSVAAPHVAGVIALMFQANPYLDYLQVKSILKDTATPLPGWTENDVGAGVVNATKAVNAALNASAPLPLIVVTKLDSADPIIEGSQLNYTIIINNTGTGIAHNITLTEAYPQGLVFHSSSPVPSSGNNVFSLGTLLGKRFTTVNITLNVSLGIPNGTLLNNSVNVSYEDLNGSQYVAQGSELTTVLGGAAISTQITDTPDPVIEGQQLVYTLTVNNTGISPAHNVTIIETYPSQVSFNASSPNASQGNNVFELGTLDSGASASVVITVDVAKWLVNGTILSNSYVVSFVDSGGEHNVSNHALTTVETLPEFDGVFTYYTSAATDKPQSRNISGTVLLAQESLPSLGANAVWIRAAASPVKNEQVLVFLDDVSDVNVQVKNRFGVTAMKELTDNTGGSTERRVDVAFDGFGKAMIVYANNSAQPAFELWNGSAFVASGLLQSSSCTDNAAWIELAAKPGSSEIIAMYTDTSGRYCAQVWDGSSWGNVKFFGQDSGIATQKFDVAYEQSSGHALAVYESSTTGKLAFCEWTGSWCESGTLLEDRGSQNDWVRLAAQPGSNRIMVGIMQKGNDDVEAVEWNGSAFGTWKLIDSGIEGAGDRMMDVAYLGTSGQAMMVWAETNKKVPWYATCANAADCFAGTWSQGTNTTDTANNCGENSDIDYVALAEKPGTNVVLMYALSQSSHYKCAQVYDGSWGSWQSNLGSGSASLSAEGIAAVFD